MIQCQLKLKLTPRQERQLWLDEIKVQRGTKKSKPPKVKEPLPPIEGQEALF